MLQSNSLSSAEVPAFEPSTPSDAVPVTADGPAGTERPAVAHVERSDVADIADADIIETAGTADPPKAAEPAEATHVEPGDASAPAPAAYGPDVVPFDLDNRQRLALVSLARGSSMKKACEDAGVGRTTLYRWINEDGRFSAAYSRWKAVTQLSAHGQVLALQDLAAEVLREQLEFKRDAKLAARILEKTGALAPPTVGPTHPGRAAAHLTAEQREQDAEIAKRVKDADYAAHGIPDEFRFADEAEKAK